jgi:hypothetical protein
VDASSQIASNKAQQPRAVPPVTNPELPKKGRRKLNKAIFDVDTAAALRTKTQARPPMTETKNPPLPEVTVQQEATGVVTPPDLPPKGPEEGTPAEHLLDVGNVVEEQLQVQSKDVS